MIGVICIWVLVLSLGLLIWYRRVETLQTQAEVRETVVFQDPNFERIVRVPDRPGRKKSRLAPLISGFSKNAIEERIIALVCPGASTI